MKKAIFLNNNLERLNWVYPQHILDKIKELVDLKSEVVTSREELLNLADLEEIEFIFSTWGMIPLSETDLKKMKSLKVLFYGAGATDAFAKPFLNSEIKVLSAWKANAVPVAEYTVSQIILGMKGFYRNNRALRVSKKFDFSGLGHGSYGEEVALLGAGEIAQKTAQLLEAYNLKVTVMPSRMTNRTISMEELFKRAFVVSNHLPDRDDNKSVIGREHFESMREGAVFINTGRGAQIDEEAMLDVLEKRTDLTAIVDVTYPEPPAENSRLFTLDNVYISGHIAGSLADELQRMADFMIDDLSNYLAGRELKNEVKMKMLISSN